MLFVILAIQETVHRVETVQVSCVVDWAGEMRRRKELSHHKVDIGECYCMMIMRMRKITVNF